MAVLLPFLPMVYGDLDVIFQQTPCMLSAYNVPMQIVNFPELRYAKVGASGICPHCGDKSYFQPVSAYTESAQGSEPLRCITAARCESCKKFILVIGARYPHQTPEWRLEAIYPLGTPNDTVPPEVEEVASDVSASFKEALRCHFIKSYRASVVMCRRAIQSSAVSLKANGGRLIAQIDDLSKSGKIT